MDPNEVIEIVYEKNNKKNNNYKKKEKKKDKKQNEGRGGQSVGGGETEGDIFFIFSLRSFSDLWKSDRRRSSEQKAKLVYATRATHRYQYLSLLSNFKM